MSTARPDATPPVRDRQALRLRLGASAALALVLAACPALAVVTPASAGTWATRTTSAAVAHGGLTLTASVSPSPSPTDSPSPSATTPPDPSASPSPDPSASATPSPTPAPTPQPTPAWSKAITPVGDTIQFYGAGNGHGVGMSQWGARGRALAGQTATDILGAYFGTSTLRATSPARAVRVLVQYAFKPTVAKPLRITPQGGPWTIDGVNGTFPDRSSLTSWRTVVTAAGVTTATWRLRVTDADGVTVLYDGAATGSSAVVRPASPATILQLVSKASFYNQYRGALTLRFHGSSVNVVNTVGLDDYVRAVTPVEMPASWPTEALSAQAIVARSWTVRHLHPTTGEFDVYDDTRSQLYQGVRAENVGVNAIIAALPGALLYYGTSVVSAFYSSAAGGWTENNEDAFVPANGIISSAPLPYLRGRDDRAPDGIAYDAGAPGFAWQTALLTHAQLDAILAADPRTSVGSVLQLDLTHRGVSGRLYQVVIYGTTATKTVSGDVFRAVFNAHRPPGMPSMLSNLFSTTPVPAAVSAGRQLTKARG